MSFSSRVLIVGARAELVSDLMPLIKGAGHIGLSVATPEDALDVIENGPIPDIIISDLGDEAREAIYLDRYRQLSRLGRHVVVEHAERPAARGTGEQIRLVYPFDEEQVIARIGELVNDIVRDLQSMRSEMLRETDGLRHIIRETQREVVAAMAMTIETRDHFMHGHCRRVGDLCLELGEELDLSAEATEQLYTAAILHEIGRAGISLELLHKTGELTPREREQLAEYPRIGGMILQRISYLKPIAQVVAHHTDDYSELAKSVPQESQQFLLISILRVADAVDTMGSERAYRAALPRNEWISTLRDGAGWRYHPLVVDAMLRVLHRRSLADIAPEYRSLAMQAA